jgi:hypothetical protein
MIKQELLVIKNNITSINFQSSQPIDSVTLESVQNALKVWRQNKKTRGEKIPGHIWELVFHLLKTNPGPESKTLAALGILRPQLEAEIKRRQSIMTPVDKKSTSVEELDFCEVKTIQEPSYPLAYKPAEAFTTTTSVVELYRKDGALMKIHICTERFDELLRAFFNGCE